MTIPCSFILCRSYHFWLRAYGEVDGLGVVDHDGGCGLLRHKLVRLGKVDADGFPGGEQLEEFRVLEILAENITAGGDAARGLAMPMGAEQISISWVGPL